MNGLIVERTRKEFNTNLGLDGAAIYYKGQGVLSNSQVKIDQFLLITRMTPTAIEVINYKNQPITLTIAQVEEADQFSVFELTEDVVAPGTGENEEPPSEEPVDEPVEEPVEDGEPVEDPTDPTPDEEA